MTEGEQRLQVLLVKPLVAHSRAFDVVIGGEAGIFRQVGAIDGLAGCLDLVTSASAKLLNLKHYGIAVGNPADLVVLDCETKAEAVCEIAQPLFGFKSGIRTFIRPAASLLKPS